LRQGELCVCHIEVTLGRRQAYISQQLMILRKARLVKSRKEGLQVFYRLADTMTCDLLDAALGPAPAGDHQPIDGCPCPRCTASGIRSLNSDTGENIMLTIKVLGPGCPNCHKVEEHTRQALTFLQPEGGYELIKVTDPGAISEYILRTPGLVINDKVACEGRVPNTNEIMTWLADALASE
jgi:DNA-binding transcriptional ArsR family regulator